MTSWLNWIEQPPPKGQVGGSSPSGVTNESSEPEPPDHGAFVDEDSARGGVGSKKLDLRQSSGNHPATVWPILACRFMSHDAT